MRKLALMITILLFILTICYPPPATIREVEIGINRIIGFSLSVLSAYIFAIITHRFIKINPYLAYILFMLSPWRNYLYTFHFPEALGLTLVLITTWLIIKKNKAWAITTVMTLAVVCWSYQSNNFASFAGGLTPKKLADEINEVQKLNFLATDKTYIMPSLLRKLIYNKPKLLTSKLIDHTVSLLDFEQFAYPLDSYEIIKLSGLSPRGNVPLIMLWEIPIILVGIFILLKQKKLSRILGCLFFAALIPYLYYEKKYLQVSGILILPIIIIVEIMAIKVLRKRKVLAWVAVALLIIPSYFSYYKFFHFESQKYTLPSEIYYREISRVINEHQGSFENIVVTDRFGPTEMMTKYYLGNGLEKVSFRAFQIKDEKPNKNTLYIGLVGEFVGSGMRLDERPVPTNFKSIATIDEGEVVFDYGNKIWIGYFDI